MKRPSSIIYLQWKDDNGDYLLGEERTWCEDKIYKYDIKYHSFEASSLDVEEYYEDEGAE